MLLDGVRLDAGAVVVDGDLDLVAQPLRGDAHGSPPSGENERAFSIRLSITWPSRES